MYPNMLFCLFADSVCLSMSHFCILAHVYFSLNVILPQTRNIVPKLLNVTFFIVIYWCLIVTKCIMKTKPNMRSRIARSWGRSFCIFTYDPVMVCMFCYSLGITEKYIWSYRFICLVDRLSIFFSWLSERKGYRKIIIILFGYW